MKRFLIPLFFLLLGTLPTLAQDNPNLITLNDATPAIDVVITLPADTTGTVSLKIAQAAVTLTDSADAVVFYAADARIHAVDLNIAPNSGSHTLTVERLADMAEAYVSVESLPELNLYGTVEHIEGAAVTVNQEISLSLGADSPGGTVAVNIPDGTTGVMTATFPGSYATTQLVDAEGVIVAQSTGGHVDGINLVLDAGNYAFTLAGSGLNDMVVAGVRVIPAEDSGIALLEAPTPTPVATADTTITACNAVVARSSANLRSGPGTGYSILGYAYLNENYIVGGRNPENNWIVVSNGSNSAWMALTSVDLQGACDVLTVFNIPLRDAEVAPIVITTPSYTDDDDREEHEEHEDSEHENNEHEEGDDD